MSIDPNTLPDGTVVETRYGEILYTSHDGSRFCRYASAMNDDQRVIQGGGDGWLTRVFAPVPEGMTSADAEAALADAGAWVEVDNFSDLTNGSRCRSEWRKGGLDLRYYVHRDDLPPADPDAELVEKMARALYPAYEGTEHLGDAWENVARAALAVVREHEAKS